MSEFPITQRTTVKRGHKRATYNRDIVHAILDEAYICHIGAKMKDRPMVQPTTHWREKDTLYIHGSSKNGLFQTLIEGEEACINITLLDGFVMARSAFHHSVNYRSVTFFSKATSINDPIEKKRTLDLMMQKITPDRCDQIREPNPQELKATAVLAFDITECSAKIRTGPPVDDEADYALPVWAGIVPFDLQKGPLINDPRWENDHT